MEILKQNMFMPDLFLMSAGRTLYNLNGEQLEEMVLILSLNCYNRAKTVTGEYLRLLKIDETRYEVLNPAGGQKCFKYVLSDNRALFDINGKEVYVEDENGIIFDPVLDSEGNPALDEEGNPVSKPRSRTLDYTNNVNMMGPSLAGAMIKTIKSHLGIHSNA